MTSQSRIYDKGERRHKHVGHTTLPEVRFEHDNPKRAIGKCPNNINQAKREALLLQAIPALNGDRNLDAPKNLYVAHEGVIYEAQTSDAGMSYHAYPYHGPLNGSLLRHLREMASASSHEMEFDAWVKAHIQPRGRWK
jgi:hypothetical protein